VRLRQRIQHGLQHRLRPRWRDQPCALAFADPDRAVRHDRLGRLQCPGALKPADGQAERSGLKQRVDASARVVQLERRQLSQPLGRLAVTRRRPRVQHLAAGNGSRSRRVAQHDPIAAPGSGSSLQRQLNQTALARHQRVRLQRGNAARQVGRSDMHVHAGA